MKQAQARPRRRQGEQGRWGDCSAQTAVARNTRTTAATNTATQHARPNRAVRPLWRRAEQRGHPLRRTGTLGEKNRRRGLGRTTARKHGGVRSGTE